MSVPQIETSLDFFFHFFPAGRGRAERASQGGGQGVAGVTGRHRRRPGVPHPRHLQDPGAAHLLHIGCGFVPRAVSALLLLLWQTGCYGTQGYKSSCMDVASHAPPAICYLPRLHSKSVAQQAYCDEARWCFGLPNRASCGLMHSRRQLCNVYQRHSLCCGIPRHPLPAPVLSRR